MGLMGPGETMGPCWLAAPMPFVARKALHACECAVGHFD